MPGRLGLQQRTQSCLVVRAADDARDAPLRHHKDAVRQIPEFFELEIAAGRLIAPYETLSENGNAYWLAYPENRRNVPKIKAFRDWIATEIKG